MTSYGTNRELLKRIGVEIPEGATSFHTERIRRGDAEIVFHVHHDVAGRLEGSHIKRTELTHKQHMWMVQQQRTGSSGWNLDEQ